MKLIPIFLLCSLCIISCNSLQEAGSQDMQVPHFDPISISSPVPTNEIENVSLTDQEKEYVLSGNEFAFKCLKQLCNNDSGESVVFSPLSLQYALALLSNGANGETANEITRSLGFGSDIVSLNLFYNKLLNEIPAVDTSARLRLANALLVNDKYSIAGSFKTIANNTYYAPLEYVPFNSREQIVELINDWASQSTDGFIRDIVNKDDISDSFTAAIMNALYFRARWLSDDSFVLFRKESTIQSRPFYKDGGGTCNVDYMVSEYPLYYSASQGFSLVELPYEKGKFAMYIILPDEKGGNGLEKTVAALSESKWLEVLHSLSDAKTVHLRLPRFNTEKRYDLPVLLQSIGINLAFIPNSADFSCMFDNYIPFNFWINNIIQKARIEVNEQGTEAAAATVVIEYGSLGEEPKESISFYADHPFVYLITEKTSGIILFTGTFTGTNKQY